MSGLMYQGLMYEHPSDPEHGSPGAGDFSMIEEIEVVDDHTVAFHLARRTRPLPMTVTNKYGAVIPEGYFDDEGAKAAMNQESVGTGLFRLQSSSPTACSPS